MTDVVQPAAGDDVPRIGRNELGTISIADSVVVRLAARAAVESPDAGASSARLLGRVVPGAGHLGTRGADLDTLPKTAVDVDGGKAYVTMELGVRWPASVAEVTKDVRSRIRDRLSHIAGLSVEEVHIRVEDLVTDVAPPPRVR